MNDKQQFNERKGTWKDKHQLQTAQPHAGNTVTTQTKSHENFTLNEALSKQKIISSEMLMRVLAWN